ncbi:hypothetical protein SCHPADRAFT_672859 [Schizopora paradoxa]|uniref:Uncharacterized protein n=1 Tax=Schizopora paradoxa TaxID=27342 RepID=A0A0H2RQ55_9AGAM|nr:hypothetical protein SCHPADRAFT_672859 [Schizopora paradoxa]
MNVTCFTFPSTLPGQATWAPNPTCRGTSNIITLCLSTTIICIWSSIHKDIPAAQPLQGAVPKAQSLQVAEGHPAVLPADLESTSESFPDHDSIPLIERTRPVIHGPARLRHRVVDDALRRLCLVAYDILRTLRNNGPTVVVAFFCPALLLLRAIDQYSSARKLRDLAEKVNVGPFTIVHGFYATMGGFQLDVLNSRTGRPFNNTTFERTRLSTDGVFFLMREYPELLSIPPVESIKERAKSNGLGKAILALQVLWFIVNCASRLAESLPLSLMEVSTLAHGLCTLLTYFAWWSKPLNVEGPTKLKTEIQNKRRNLEGLEIGPEDDAKIARWKCWVHFFDNHTYGDHFQYVGELFKALPVDPSLVDDPVARARELAKDLRFLLDSLRDEYSQTFRESPEYRKLLYLAGETEHAGSGEVRKNKVLDGVRRLALDIFQERLLVRMLREAAYNASERSQTTPMAMALLDMDQDYSYPKKGPQDVNIFDLLRPKSSTNPRTNPTLAEERDFSRCFLHETSPTFHDLFGAFTLTTSSRVKAIDYISLSVTPLLYGSLHLLGWWKQFPSSAEQIVWRVATVVAMSSGFAATVVCLIHDEALKRIFSWFERRNIHIEELLLVVGRLLQALVGRIIPSLYVLSSTFLMVESIRQLWFLPSDAYILASWSYYFPHLF